MNLIRLIALAALCWLLYRLILSLLSKVQRPTRRHEAEPKGGAMVRCAQCGLHVPQVQALEKDGNYYCCTEHRDADDRWKRDA